jgi:PKHD-type hydroxylase
MNVTYAFDQKETDSQNYYFYQNGFNKNELDRIEKGVARIEYQKATIVGGDVEKQRQSRIKWIPQNMEWWWLYEKLGNYAQESNKALWNFDLHSMPEQIQYTEYLGTNKGHYDWHADIGPGILSKRKVSITVQLSHPDEYEGGDLELFRGGSMEGPFEKAERNQGCVFIFPSYTMHRVTPVTKGIRKSFVLWLGGGHYR